MHVYEYHVHCFGCGFHGDVVKVWSAQKGFERQFEAALDLAREFNVRLPEMSPEARQKAQEQRSREGGNLESARAFHEFPALKEWWKGRGFDATLRERFLLGANKEGTEAVIPFWSRGRVVGSSVGSSTVSPGITSPRPRSAPTVTDPSSSPAPCRARRRSSSSRATSTPWPSRRPGGRSSRWAGRGSPTPSKRSSVVSYPRMPPSTYSPTPTTRGRRQRGSGHGSSSPMPRSAPPTMVREPRISPTPLPRWGRRGPLITSTGL